MGRLPALARLNVPGSREAAAVGLAFLAAVGVRLPSLAQPLLEYHWFRQTQTAYTALLYHRDGIDLLHPRLPVLGPPFEVPFEFPLFQALAALAMNLGVSPDPALRLTSLGGFLLTAFLLWGILRRLAGRGAALAALVFFLFSPFGLVWSRTSMIEYLATAGALGFLWAGIAWRDGGQRWWWMVALLAGLVGCLVKPTTAVFWLIPFLAYRTEREARNVLAWTRACLRPACLALVVIPIVAALVWTWHADAIKASSRTTTWLTSDALRTWTFGTLPQRFEPGAWIQVAARVEQTLIGWPFIGLLPIAIVGMVRSSQPLVWAAIGVAGVLPVATFFNLYVVHDYYLAAISPALAALMGLGASTLWQYRWRARARRLLAAAGLAAAGLVGVQTASYWRPIYEPIADPSRALPLARELAALSRSDDLVVVVGRDWSPDVLYYARRVGLMLAPPLLKADVIQGLPGDLYRILASANPNVDPIGILRAWRWTGVIGARIYVMGDSAEELRGASVVATDDLSAYAAVRSRGRQLLAQPLEIQCGVGAGTNIPRGTAGTWLRLRNEAGGSGARIHVARGLAPVPARTAIAVGPTDAADPGQLTLACSGTRSVTVDEVVDAPVRTAHLSGEPIG